MNKKFKELYTSDEFKSGGRLKGWNKKFHYYFRRCQTCQNKILLLYYKFRFKLVRDKHHIEMPGDLYIGKGFYFGHPFCININPNVKIGDNFSIHKGATIGQENRGKRKGVPTIGNKVWLGINSTVVGNITIGDDVLIAPNSYVNCDVPSHSVVIGNPCVIHHKDEATKNYINNCV